MLLLYIFEQLDFLGSWFSSRFIFNQTNQGEEILISDDIPCSTLNYSF